MPYDKCKTCLHQDEVGKPVFDDKNCATCITRGSYLGYEPAPKVESLNMHSKYDRPIIWISLILVHTCFIIACLTSGLYLSVFLVNPIWIIITALAAAAIDAGFVYIIYLLLGCSKSKKE